MNRRGFLGPLLGAVASAALDPERLLWVPGAKIISIPKAVPMEFEDGLIIRLIRQYCEEEDRMVSRVEAVHLTAARGYHVSFERWREQREARTQRILQRACAYGTGYVRVIA